MTKNLLLSLLNHPLEKDADFVRSALRLLESQHQEQDLLDLADWQQLNVFIPEPYQPISSLIRPSWGMWNRIVQELRKAEQADSQAMLELGIIYDRDNELDKAEY